MEGVIKIPLLFETYNALYIENRLKSTTSFKNGKTVEFEELKFRDIETKRIYFVQNWSGLEVGNELKKNCLYYLRGFINSNFHQLYLNLCEIAEIKDNKLIDPFKQKEGIATILLPHRRYKFYKNPLFENYIHTSIDGLKCIRK